MGSLEFGLVVVKFLKTRETNSSSFLTPLTSMFFPLKYFYKKQEIGFDQNQNLWKFQSIKKIYFFD